MACGLRDTAVLWQRQGRPAVVVEVQRHQGSVPRETGTHMLVAADEVAGTIGGGHLEWRALADARAMLGVGCAGAAAPHAGPGGRPRIPHTHPSPHPSPHPHPHPNPHLQRIALGPSLGQCCGGVVELLFTPLDSYDISAWPAPVPLFTLQLYGAGHVGRAIVGLLADIECRVQWIDERDSEFPADDLPPHIEKICAEPVQAEVDNAPAGAFYLVLTHSHDLDLALTQAILARGDFAYFGLIGSRTKRARFESRLRQHGVPLAQLARMHCPIGMPDITGKQPAVIAVAVVAQLLQLQTLLQQQKKKRPPAEDGS